MKKISQILIAVVLAVGFVGITDTSTAGAEECDVIIINGTGSDSDNVVECQVRVDVEVECIDNIYVLNENSQEAVTGEVEDQGNTTGGAAVSGNATNSNGATVQIGAECVSEETPETPVTPTTPTTPETPVTPAAVVTPTVAVLPNTATNSITGMALAVIAAVVAILVASRLAITVYRRKALK